MFSNNSCSSPYTIVDALMVTDMAPPSLHRDNGDYARTEKVNKVLGVKARSIVP